MHVHPSYNNSSHGFDIALLRLKKLPDLEPSELWPVCLPEQVARAGENICSGLKIFACYYYSDVVQEVESYAGTKATVVGWGKTSGKEAKSSARILQVLWISIIYLQDEYSEDE